MNKTSSEITPVSTGAGGGGGREKDTVPSGKGINDPNFLHTDWTMEEGNRWHIYLGVGSTRRRKPRKEGKGIRRKPEDS